MAQIKCKMCDCEYDASIKYCPSCGYRTEKAMKIMYCYSCGSKIEDGMRYCYKCGTELKIDTASAATPILDPLVTTAKPISTVKDERIITKKGIRRSVNANLPLVLAISGGALMLICAVVLLALHGAKDRNVSFETTGMIEERILSESEETDITQDTQEKRGTEEETTEAITNQDEQEGSEYQAYRDYLWSLVESADELADDYVRVPDRDGNGDGVYDVEDDAAYYYYFAIEDFDSDGIAELLLRSEYKNPVTGQWSGGGYFFYKYDEASESVERCGSGAIDGVSLDDIVFYSNGIIQLGDNGYIAVNEAVYSKIGVFPVTDNYGDTVDSYRGTIYLKDGSKGQTINPGYEMDLCSALSVDYIIDLTEEEYRAKLSALTSGNVLDPDIKVFNKENVALFCN